jgi:hypothetical protein
VDQKWRDSRRAEVERRRLTNQTAVSEQATLPSSRLDRHEGGFSCNEACPNDRANTIGSAFAPNDQASSAASAHR